MRRPGAVLLICALLACGCRAGLVEFPWPRGEARAATVVRSTHVRDLLQGYRRTTSTVLVRKITSPTRANLDLAAHWANCMLRQPPGPSPDPGPARVPDRPQLFGGVLVAESMVSSLARTPLSETEKRRPMAFSPMVDFLARSKGGPGRGLMEAQAGVREEAWALRKRPGTYFQQISTAYLHRAAGGAQLWVKVEFEPWARLFEAMEDEDGGGHPEVYARIKAALPEGVIKRLEKDYLGRRLSTRQVHAWANELASYWYPSFNTDVVKLAGARSWPMASTEPAVVAALRGVKIAEPTVVIRGKPRGRPIYNVFVVPGVAPLDGPAAKGGGKTEGDQRDRWLEQLRIASVSPRLAQAREALERQLQEQGGWSAWVRRAAPLQSWIRMKLRKRPGRLKALQGEDGFLFYRNSLRYVVGGDIQAQPAGKNPLSTIVQFKDYLRARGVDFLLVPVPAKPEVFPDKLRGLRGYKPGKLPVLNPHGRKFLLELNRAGVEVVDLLPLYLKAREKRRASEEPLYQPQDTHWTDRGLRLAAAHVAARVRLYPWYPVLRRRAQKLTVQEVSFRRFGDLHSRLSTREQRGYKPAKLRGQQVLTPAGKLYEDDPQSPIIVLGDSFTGVYQRTYCRHAGVTAHLARELGHAVDLVMSYGGGPNVRRTLLTRGPQALKKKRLLIWLLAARDFYDYWEDWEPLSEPAGAPQKKPGRKR